MSILQDLVPDPTTKNLWQCRPAAVPIANFTAPGGGFSSGFSSGFASAVSFPTATFISCLKVIGTRAYGMVSTSRNPGHDEPFVYDIPSGLFIQVIGVTNANTPVSPPTTGPWVPPNLDLIGSKIIVAHSGFSGAGGAFFGVLDITNLSAPTWTAQNTTTNALVAPPQFVQNFNGRCFFLVNPTGAQPGAYMSDELNATQITNASQILTFGDNVPLTAAAGLPLENQLGGIIQSLIIFKSATNMYQVTGDFSLTNLAVNALNVATGTFGPNTIVTTSQGIAFAAPDGLRIIDFTARVSDPIGKDGDGITVPFYQSMVPSRMNAAYNNGVYRIQLQNAGAQGAQQQWWFDFVREIWSGPHTIATTLMQPYAGNTFIVVLQALPTSLFQSDVQVFSTSVFVENGNQLSWVWATPMLPDTDQMAENALIETTLHLALITGNNVNVAFQNQSGNVLDSVTIVPTGSSNLWGSFVWGVGLWQGSVNALYPKQLNWHFPIVFRRGGIVASGTSIANVKIGRLHMRYQVLNYLQQAS